MQKYTLATVPAPANNKLPLMNENIFITRDGLGIAELLAQRLQMLGHQVHVVNQLPPKCDIAIVLDALQNFSNKETAIAINHQVFSQARIVAPHFEKQGGIFIAVQDTGGNFALTAADHHKIYASGMSGLIKTAAQEWPKARCKVIDLACANLTREQLAEKLLSEIFIGDNHLEVGLLANGQRVTLQLQPMKESASKVRINHRSVMVVSGGARGVTASCLIELAKKIKTRFVLLGRTVLENEPSFCNGISNEAELKQKLFAHFTNQKIAKTPKQIQSDVSKIIANRETQATIAKLKNLGSEVLYYPTDIQNKDALSQTLNTVRNQWGPITAVVHGAGVLADKLISQKTDEQFKQVFNTKVMGLKNLLEVTQADPLNAILLFSSVAGRFGNPGQVDYSMANEVLNKIANHEQRQRGAACLVKSINWGPWESGMVTPELKKMFAERGIPILSLAEGTQIFIDELASSVSAVEVVIGGPLQAAVSTDSHGFSVDAKSYAYLKDHVVEDVPVLPACIVMDWFVRTAKKLYPNRNYFACQNFRVLKGIRLEKFYQAAQAFSIEKNNNALLLKSSEQTTPHYSAEIIETTSFAPIAESNKKQIWPWDLDEIYVEKNALNNSRRLFHGPDFYAIDALEHVSDQGGSAIIKNMPSRFYNQHALDFLALDGILQLAILWGVRMLGKVSLPTYIQEFYLHDLQLPKDKMHCKFHAEFKDNRRFYLNADLIKPNGEIYLTLRGLEMCIINAKVPA